jgi:hypothetical protein
MVSRSAERRWRWWFPLLAVPLVAVVLWDAYWVVRHLLHLRFVWDGSAYDWHNLAEAARLANPYDQEWYRWSPVAVWILLPLTALGLTAWRIAQVAAVLLLRDIRAIVLVLLSAPFWSDVQSGQTLTFLAVTSWHAVAGSRLATWLLFAMAVLMPRPLMLPVVAWLLWQRPETRRPFLVVAAGHLILVIASSHALDWITRLVQTTDEFEHFTNIAPSQWIGWWWVPVGAILGLLLTLKGRIGLASVVVSPYLFSYYLLMLVLELGPRKSTNRLARSME